MAGLAWGLVAACLTSAPAQPMPSRAVEVLLERTLAVVGGAVVTQSDVELAAALGLLDDVPGPATASPIQRLVDRQLMLHEVARFSPPDPSPAAVRARLDATTVHAGSVAAVTAVLGRAGATPARLEAWVRDDLRMAAYVDQRFAAAGTPAEADVAAYLGTYGAALTASGVAPSDLPSVARQRLIADRRRALVADWLVDLRRRSEVVEFKE